jgi:HEAT repeat protein
MRGKRLVLIFLLLASALGVGGWQRHTILAWWYVRQLSRADEASRDAWIKRVCGVEEAAALPRLLDRFAVSAETPCRNVEAALVAVAQRQRPLDVEAARLLAALRDRFADFSPAGRGSALRVAAAILNCGAASEMLPVTISQPAGDLLLFAQSEENLRPPLLQLASALLARVPPGQWLDACRQFALQGLHDRNPATRAAALHLALGEPLRSEPDVVKQALPLLHDGDADVRRTAVLVLGSAPELVTEDELLPLLHDPDLQVQQTCELALRGRGLQDRQLELARLISDENPTARLRVLQQLRGSDVEPGVWLRRLSHDPAPAVRAAAVRAVCSHPEIDLRERLREITRQDASPTVRELASHYLQSK